MEQSRKPAAVEQSLGVVEDLQGQETKPCGSCGVDPAATATGTWSSCVDPAATATGTWSGCVDSAAVTGARSGYGSDPAVAGIWAQVAVALRRQEQGLGNVAQNPPPLIPEDTSGTPKSQAGSPELIIGILCALMTVRSDKGTEQVYIHTEDNHGDKAQLG